MRICEGNVLVATHRRSFDRNAQIEDARHIEALVAHKRAARAHRAQDRLHHSAPSTGALFLRAALERAIHAALSEDAAHLGAVRHFIDQHAREAALPPPIAVRLPADPRLLELLVRPHALRDYEQLTRSSDERHDHDGDNDGDHNGDNNNADDPHP